MPGGAAPLLVCFLPQLASVVGDGFGQRCCRVYHRRSQRRFLIAMAAVTSIQMFIAILIIQVAFPKIATTIQQKNSNGTYYDYCATEEGKNSNDCYAQGPLTVHKAVGSCPMLLLDPVINIFYYLGEAILYSQSIGVILIVLAALSSSFIVSPLQVFFSLQNAKSVPAIPVMFGIAGALLCLVERGKNDEASTTLQQNDETTHLDPPAPNSMKTIPDVEDPSEQACAEQLSHSTNNDTAAIKFSERVCICFSALRKNLPLLLPFSMLSVTYALYFVLMDFYNEKCKINLWGYNAFDQMNVVIILYSAFLLFDSANWLRKLCVAPDEQNETLMQAFKGSWTESTQNCCEGLFYMFIYRFMINGRALVYTYIVTSYDLAASYLELTLIRVVLSWIISLLLVLVVPKFIEANEAERRTLKDKINILLKLMGTVLILVSLFFLHRAS